LGASPARAMHRQLWFRAERVASGRDECQVPAAAHRRFGCRRGTRGRKINGIRGTKEIAMSDKTLEISISYCVE
jgi:hypothetical protein